MVVDDGHTLGAQTFDVGDALVTQDVEAGGDTTAGGRPVRDAARSGLTMESSLEAGSGAYCCHDQALSSVVRPYPSAHSRAEGVSSDQSTAG